MPTSNHGAISLVLEVLVRLRPQSILDVGTGRGKYGVLCREYFPDARIVGIEGWQDASETLNVTLELVRRGYSEDDIAKLWGGNLLRVWRENERVARELQSSRN